MGAELQRDHAEFAQKTECLIQSQSKEQRFQFIEDHHSEFSVEKMCKLLQVSRSGYYKWLLGKADENSYQKRRAALTNRIISLFRDYDGKYGSPKITEYLRQEGWVLSERFVGRIMKENGLKANLKRRG
ncbi:hypothetical protein A8709_12215 [Paenibacillus pectinilyticus]|uniref:HTH-like domain-containing protein n=1 Tax=Paenibacillus pectinilyticus TaxID=512399 RepID=A0A1C1A2X0_9BACL|nr:IS3 family transposase [Paenibacillus pectinilyticus]OCT14894.1 hypothetical protein A8709_12215 [Paenibacillus pectinilyticus]